MIIRVRVVLRRTVWGDFDWAEVIFRVKGKVECQEMVYTGMSLAVNLIGQRSRDVIGRLSVSRDVIGCEDCKKWLVRFDPSFVSQ